MKKLTTPVFIVFLFTKVSAQRVVTHTDLIPRMLANTEYKIGTHKIYEDKLNQVRDDREKTLAYATAIEQVQGSIYKSFTNVDAGLRNGKTLIYISKKVPDIF